MNYLILEKEQFETNNPCASHNSFEILLGVNYIIHKMSNPSDCFPFALWHAVGFVDAAVVVVTTAVGFVDAAVVVVTTAVGFVDAVVVVVTTTVGFLDAVVVVVTTTVGFVTAEVVVVTTAVGFVDAEVTGSCRYHGDRFR